MGRRDLFKWVAKRLLDVARAARNGDWVAVASLILIASAAAVFFYWKVIRPRLRVIPEDRWVAPDSEELKRLLGGVREGDTEAEPRPTSINQRP